MSEHVGDPVTALDQALPIARALANQDAKVVATFWTSLRMEIDEPYDVLELTREYLATRLDRDE